MENSDGLGNGDILKVMPAAEIAKILECPVCKEVPMPPIYTCETGHIICTFCREKLEACGICREKYTKGRNFPLEAIFHGTTFLCKFKANGCDEIIPGEQYHKHTRNCRHRSIECSFCFKDIYPIDDYINHIKTKHNADGYDREMFEYLFENWTYDINADSLYGDDYAFCDGKYFVSSLEVKNQVVYQWISIIGNDDDAKQYTAKFTIYRKSGNGNSNQSIPRVEWTIPVVSIQKGKPDYSLCSAILVDPTLKPFLLNNMKVKNGRSWKYVWHYKITIDKI